MRWLPVGLFAVLLALPAPSLSADPPKQPTVEELVADLGDPVFSVREKAQRDLWKRGEEAIPLLEKAAKGEDPEAARRAKELLDKFAWGILPDTPPAVLKLIKQYQVGDPDPNRADEVRRTAVTELLKHGKTGVSVVRAILKKDLPVESRAKLAAMITTLVRREVPLLLVAGKTDEADAIVGLHSTGTTPEGAADFAAYHVLRGDLPVVIAQAESMAKAGNKSDQAKLVLTHLYRAAGMWAKAREAADGLPDPPEEATYKELLLEDEGNWAALADLGVSRELNHPDASRLMLMRLAGRKDKFEEAVKKIRSDADDFGPEIEILDATVALLANHRAESATELLLEKKRNLALLSEVLIARMRYKQALELIGTGKKEKETVNATERLDFNLRRARVLMMTGYRDDAVSLFNEVARGLAGGGPLPGTPRLGAEGTPFTVPARALIRTEVRLGLRDLACEHATLFLPAPGETQRAESAGESPFELLFPNDPIAAETLFTVLRAAKVPGDAAGATMLRTRDLLTGTAGKAAVDEAVKLLREAAGRIPNEESEPNPTRGPYGNIVRSSRLLKAQHHFTLAMVCRAAKRGDDADAAFKAAAGFTENASGASDVTGARSWVYGAPDPARVWIEWADFLSDAARHRDAANVLEAAWKLYPDQPLPLYLSGRALVTAGEVKEGERRIELSHWVSLGNEKVRGRFLDELVRRSESKAIKREVALILKACWSRDHYFGNVMNQCARGAALIGDFATAELCGTRSLLVVMRNQGVYFVDTASYLTVPHDLLAYHARAALAAGKIDEAMTAAREVLAVTPGHVDLVTGMVPKLDSLGKKKEADELFKLVWTAYQKMLADYPDSPSARAALAQLSAHCRRNLDDGLKYAKAAVASDPGSVAYREVLAEVQFRRGDRDAAVKLVQNLSDEQPRNALYKRQLTRYRTAAFDSPWPTTAE